MLENIAALILVLSVIGAIASFFAAFWHPTAAFLGIAFILLGLALWWLIKEDMLRSNKVKKAEENAKNRAAVEEWVRSGMKIK